jgi:predicted nucleic acid-binding protein
MILLDTNVVSALMLKQPERHVLQWLDQQDPRQVWLPSVVAAEQAAVLAAQRQTRGCSVDLRDTLIAGIALANGARLATRNVRHFSDTTISLINPFPPAPESEP